MDLEQFKQDYPSAVVKDGTIFLSEEDLAKLHESIATAAPENVKTFYYHGYTIEKQTEEAKAK